MRHVGGASYLLVVIVLSTVTGRLNAQTDLRISPPDATTYLLPQDLRIQSAARFGESILAVWGSRDVDSNGVGIERLTGRLLSGDSIGTVQVHSSSARPFGFVSVLVIDTVYLVIWNDRRSDSPGVYLSRIDRAGKRLSDEMQIGPGTVTDGRIWLAGDPSLAPVILWNSNHLETGRSFVARLTTSGIVSTMFQPPGSSTISDILRFQTLPGATVVRMSNGSAWYLHPDDRFDLREVSRSVSSVSHFFADSTTAEVQGSTVNLYTSLFDSSSYRSMQLPMLDSAIAGTVTVTSANPGELTLAWFHYHDPPNEPGIRIDLRTTRVTRDGEIRSDSIIVSHLVQGYPPSRNCFPTGFELKNAAVVRGCDNRYDASITYAMTYYGECVPDNRIFRYQVTSDGRVEPGAFGKGCPSLPGAVQAIRLLSDTIGSVAVIAEPDTLVFSEPIPGVAYPYDEMGPALFLDEGTLGATWTSMASTRGYVIATRSPEITTWTTQPVMVPPPVGIAGSGRHVATHQNYQEHGLYPGNRISAVVNDCHRIDEFESAAGHTIIRTTYMTSAVRVYTPTSTGWVLRVGDYFTSSTERINLSLETMGSSPEGDVLVSIVGSAAGRYVGRVRGDTLISFWRNVLPGTGPISLVALGGDSAVAINGTTAIVLHAGAEVGRMQLDTTYPGVRYHPTLDRQLLRLDRDAGDSTLFTATLIDPAGGANLSRELRFAAAPDEISVTQNPGNGTIALVWTALGKVYRSFLGPRQLTLLEHERVVSDTDAAATRPNALFHNDSLHIVWQDRRNESLDIYYRGFPAGVAEPIADVPAVDSDDTHDGESGGSSAVEFRSIEGLFPNPAASHVTIPFALPYRSRITVEIYSINGEMVRRLELGEYQGGRHSAEISLTGIPQGSYLMRVVSRFGDDFGKLLVEPVR